MPRWILASLSALLAAAPSSAQTLATRRVASGLVHPVCVTAPAGDLHRLFVVEQDGRVRIVRDGVLLPAPFLDIDAEVESLAREQGLLALAFHPQYASNGKYYVCFTDLAWSIVVREYVASTAPSLDVDVSDTSVFRDVVGPIPKPAPTHNGGCLQFGPDGKLYVALGDGGGGYDTGPGHAPVAGNALSLASPLGKLLRVDVDAGPPFDPGDNPWSDDTDGIDDLIWARGLRNPWRFSFDAANGDLYLADVGQNFWEEVDWLPHALGFGANFGWRSQEALHCTGYAGCVCNVPAGTNPALVDPVIEYPHAGGQCAVMGGVVYRGGAMPTLAGTYFYSEYCTGAVWSCRIVNGAVTNHVDRTAELDPPGADVLNFVTAFGADGNGELHLCDYYDGEIYRIVEACAPPAVHCVGAPNSVGPGARMGWSGSGSLAQNDLVLRCTGLPPNSLGFYFSGAGRAQTPLGNGYLCIASDFWRLGAVPVAADGSAVRGFDAFAFPPRVDPGETWQFQFYYRNVAAGGALFNLSDALEVPFCD
ncbi:MAG: PQQ-dependent sugar dehydrogenase [Planctomycetes bacterium]|nr:PQQ-dependent sugar dehydrogenase [Planctomycetota bacterium]